MPNSLQNVLIWTIRIVVMVVLAAIPFSIAMWFGLAWAILASIVLAGLIGWQCGQDEMTGPVVAVLTWGCMAAGLVAAAVWKVYGLILSLLS